MKEVKVAMPVNSNVYLFVMDEVPFQGISGAGILAESFILGCVEKDITLHVLLIGVQVSGNIDISQKIAFFEEKGIHFHFINFEKGVHRPRFLVSKLFFPTLTDLFPGAYFSKKRDQAIQKVVDISKANCCVAYTFSSAFYCKDLKINKCTLVLEDILAILQSNFNGYKKLSLVYFIKFLRRKFLQRQMIDLVNDNYNFCAHLSFDFYNNFNSARLNNSHYLDHPCVPTNQTRAKILDRKNHLTIGIMGQLSAVNRQVYNEWLKPILRSLKVSGFENRVKIIGGLSDKTYQSQLFDNYNNIEIESRIVSLHNFYNSVDLLFCPTSTSLGVRTRVIEAMSYGVPSVVSMFDQLACPTLRHSKNCILIHNPDDFLNCVKSIFANPKVLNEMSQNCVDTYSNIHKPSVFFDNFNVLWEMCVD